MQTGFLLMKNKSSGNKEYEGAYNKETLNIMRKQCIWYEGRVFLRH